ncbi:polysaccharide deacetylase family protein [bacterium]|nr:polysaccharide deacetylase family protein [bacterium]
MKLVLKRTLSAVLYYSGALRVLKLVLLKDKAVVLMYHRVLTKEERDGSFSHSGIVVEREVFEKQMRFLGKEFTIIGESEFNLRLKEKRPFETASCLVTFDDGWLDNATNALPALKKNGIPALVFLAHGYIGTGKMFWQERMTALLSAAFDDRAGNSALLAGYGLKAGDAAGRLPAIRRFIESQKKRTHSEIEETLRELSDSIPVRPGPGRDRFLGAPDIAEMLSGGVSFGSHGVSHRILTMLPRPEAESEIRDSRSGVALLTGRTPSSFSYPNGDHDDYTAALVEKHGYDAAFTTREGFVRHTDDPFRLKRVNIHNDATMTVPMFFCRILGVF